MTADEQFRGALIASLLPLRFLTIEERRRQQREQMPGFKDSAIFYRLWDLLGAIREPDVQARLSEEEKRSLSEFTETFQRLAWRPLPSHPHVSELAPDDLSPLVHPAQQKTAERGHVLTLDKTLRL